MQDEARAREFLAAEYEATAPAGKYVARDIRAGNLSPENKRAIRAMLAFADTPRPTREGVGHIRDTIDGLAKVALWIQRRDPLATNWLHCIQAAALLAQREQEGWRDIASAPKDGTVIILGAPEQQFEGKPVEPRATVGHWLTEEECRERVGDCGGECRCPEYIYHDPYWMSYDGGFTAENPPTHWMPLPTPPVEEGDRGAAQAIEESK